MSEWVGNWRDMISEEFMKHGEVWEDIVFSTLTDEDLDKDFGSGYGMVEGCGFTVWTKEWVYFPICYDGAEWVGRAPRNPCDTKMSHQGGG